MPRRTVNELTAMAVSKITKPGYHRVGGVSGLCLLVKPSGTKSWILRMTFGGKRRDLGLGSYPSVTLSMARERTRRVLDTAWAGTDPFAGRDAQRATAAAEKRIEKITSSAPTFRDAVLGYLADNMPRDTTPKGKRHQFESSIAAYALPVIGDLPVTEVNRDHIITILRPIWHEKSETARRVRRRIENVLSWATVLGYREGENPAAWRGNLQHVLPALKEQRQNQPACPVADVPSFMAALRSLPPSSKALALQFLILTAARSKPVRLARWGEIDLEAGMWNVPGENMKTGKPLRVPLSPAALDVLRASPRFAGTDLIWPGERGLKPLGDNKLSEIPKLLNAAEAAAGRPGWRDRDSGKDATPHGFRSSFRDWAAEHTEYPRELAEIALAHDVGSSVERAYMRSDMVEKRRELMNDWGRFVFGS